MKPKLTGKQVEQLRTKQRQFEKLGGALERLRNKTSDHLDADAYLALTQALGDVDRLQARLHTIVLHEVHKTLPDY